MGPRAVAVAIAMWLLGACPESTAPIDASAESMLDGAEDVAGPEGGEDTEAEGTLDCGADVWTPDAFLDLVPGDGGGSDAPQDAAPDLAAPFCGDGTCDSALAEDPASCVIDCGGNQATDCIRDRCADALGACLDDTGCVSIFTCLLGCDDTPCAQQCYLVAAGDPEAVQLMAAAVDCGQSEGCFQACGNGTCGDDEDGVTCPADCALDCIHTACGEQTSACEGISGCPELLACWAGCDSYACTAACLQAAPPQAIAALQSIEACAALAGCVPDSLCGDGSCEAGEDETTCPADCAVGPVCGDGTCDSLETSAECPQDCAPTGSTSCADNCGTYEQGAPCQCDNQCDEYGDCCLDIYIECDKDFCGDGTCTDGEDFVGCPDECPEPVCGDGACEPPEDGASCSDDCAVCDDGICGGEENPESCPQDCPAACGDTFCTGGEDLASCPEDCLAYSCTDKCGSYDDGWPCNCDGQCQQYDDCCLDINAQCGADFCGDTLCTGAEDAAGCPEDCPADPCPDGVCGADEDASSCFTDCFAPCMEACQGQQETCHADSECGPALQDCVPPCSGDTTCSANCGAALSPPSKLLLDAVIACGASEGCLQ